MKNSRWRLQLPSIRVAIAAAILAALWFELLTLGTGPADLALGRLLYAGGHPALIAIAKLFTFLGEPAVLIGLGVAAGYTLWAKGERRYGVAVLLLMLVGRGLAEVQKYSIMRFRPEDEAHLVQVSTPSFPSGHATSSMIVYLTLALVFASHRWKWPAVAGAVILSFCIGISRVMLGVHWPTDVMGGWAFGLLWVLVALPEAERLAKPQDLG
jgi:undecaprenyl-diphosphatase